MGRAKEKLLGTSKVNSEILGEAEEKAEKTQMIYKVK